MKDGHIAPVEHLQCKTSEARVAEAHKAYKRNGRPGVPSASGFGKVLALSTDCPSSKQLRLSRAYDVSP